MPSDQGTELDQPSSDIRETITERVQQLFDLGRRSKPLWWYPALSLAGGLILGLGLSRVGTGGGTLSLLVYEGDPESARSFVSLAAASVATITSLTLTITVVSLQLASSQYSPRLIEHHLNDRGIRAVISLFMMTFAFSVATLLNVRLAGDADDATGQVPGIAISLLVVLIVGCLGALVFFVYRVTQSIRVESILEVVRDRSLEAVDDRLRHDPEGEEFSDIPELDPDARLVLARQTGFFVAILRDQIEEVEVDGDIRIWVLVSPGDFVISGAPVAAVSGWDDDDAADEIISWLRFDSERWIEADYSYGVRSLADVALKALSPGINDPTTAIMAVNRIGEVLAAAATSHPDRIIEFGSAGRLFITVKTWEWTLHETLHQLALYGKNDVNLVVSVIRMLWSLLWLDASDRRREQIRRAGETFASMIETDRSEPDQAVVDDHLELLRESFEGEPVRMFRPAVPSDRPDATRH